MRISITDKFLWDVYKYLEKIGEVVGNIPKKRQDFYNLGGIKNPIFEKYRRDVNRRQFADFIRWLKSSNYIKVEQLKGKQAVMLTKKGIDRAIKAKFKIENYSFEKRKDGKWIMIIFDIPQKRNKSRNLLRSILKNLGYEMFQQSVWITPYDISEKTEELLQFYSLDEFVRIFLIEDLN